MYLSTDEALKIVRATKTSTISGTRYKTESNEITVSFVGESDVATSFWLFGEKKTEIVQELISVPAFKKGTEITLKAL
jgi:hypothetical protein